MPIKTHDLAYQPGFGNDFESEALPGALPQGQNNPREAPYGLYAEQLSGTAFTAPRKHNQRSWFYRLRPSVTHTPFSPVASPSPPRLVSDFAACVATPNQLRWQPAPAPSAPTTWMEGLTTVCGAGNPGTKSGFAIHLYSCNASMAPARAALANADGDFLIVPQLGTLRVVTEFGVLGVASGEICVVQRGMRFRIDLEGGEGSHARGYVLEVFAGHFVLPDLGPIGANGLANPRDFLSPVAAYEEEESGAEGEHFTVYHKFEGVLFESRQEFSPFNVVAWHGNYVPYKYDLSRFCPMNAVAFDHPDPSIFTVLTCPSDCPGTAVADFVIFPPRWAVSEHTFRPPYFHRNVMSEFMGLIRGEYDAKAGGFVPGGSSLHMCMSAHGPDATSYANAIRPVAENPAHLPRDTLAFMFETYFTPRLTPAALAAPTLEHGYYKVWQGLKSGFNANWKPVSASSTAPPS